MASQVTYSNLFSESRNNVVALITTSNVPDPGIISTEYRKRIYSRDPDVKSADFKGYPYIIVNPAQCEPFDGGSFDGKHKVVSWIIEIEIVTSDRGYGSKDGNGMSDMDSMSNDIIETFLNVANRRTLSVNNLSYSRPISTSVVSEEFANEKIYRRSILLNFKNKITVSS